MLCTVLRRPAVFQKRTVFQKVKVTISFTLNIQTVNSRRFRVAGIQNMNKIGRK